MTDQATSTTVTEITASDSFKQGTPGEAPVHTDPVPFTVLLMSDTAGRREIDIQATSYNDAQQQAAQLCGEGEYVLNFQPKIPDTEIPDTENPDTENPEQET